MKKTRRVLLINGCSHSVGSESVVPLDGDSVICRKNCFGAYLAKKLDRSPVNLAIPGGSNDWIARSTACWIADNAESIANGSLDVLVLIHWTGAERWEFRFASQPFYTHFIDYEHDYAYKSFTVRQTTVQKYTGFQAKLFEWFERIFAEDPPFWSDNKIKNIIFLQELLKNHGCKFWFGNAFDTYMPTKTSNSLLKLLDKENYPYLDDKDMSYLFMCTKEGFGRQSELLWHLPKEAHAFYADFLEKEFKKLNLK